MHTHGLQALPEGHSDRCTPSTKLFAMVLEPNVMAKRRMKKLSPLHLRIVDALRKHPKGLHIGDIRRLAVKRGDRQQHLDKRVRELSPYFVIDRPVRGRYTIYKYIRRRKPGEWNAEGVSNKLRSHVIHMAHGKCQMCGRTVAEDGIRLHVDHRIPQRWGGTSDVENLWAICSSCNEGKKDYFSSLPDNMMVRLASTASVHQRLAKLLNLKAGKWVSSDFLRSIANLTETQDDWQRRLREIRPFVRRLEKLKVHEEKRVTTHYRFPKRIRLPKNLAELVKRREKRRRMKAE